MRRKNIKISAILFICPNPIIVLSLLTALPGGIFLQPLPLSANDTLVGESGHTVFPIDTDKVRMVSEYVKIRMDTYDLKGITSKARRAFVSCDFVFENTSSEEIKAQLGFPGDIFRWTDGVTAPTLNDFMWTSPRKNVPRISWNSA